MLRLENVVAYAPEKGACAYFPTGKSASYSLNTDAHFRRWVIVPFYERTAPVLSGFLLPFLGLVLPHFLFFQKNASFLFFFVTGGQKNIIYR
jgi:hypothetical protein